MRKVLLPVVILLLTLHCAHAEIPCQCGQANCLCFIQLGDEGPAVEFIQNTLIVRGYLAPNDDTSDYDEKTVSAVMRFQQDNGLSPTGRMDDETLTLLLWGMLPIELNAAQPGSSTVVVWIPTDGGIRHHDLETCSGMYDPRLVSQRNAHAMNMLHCGRCKPPGYVKPAK
jgi:peptidoglycan hydrolase-like protein with peptidoglycan-binding domain